MSNGLKRVDRSVVVVTGASGGIGRATAVAFARGGAAVVLAARRADALAEVAAECRRAGAPQVLVVPTDVTDAAAVDGLARQAIERLGRIDTWVNNACVASIGRLEETPPAAFRQVIETNLIGTANGCRAAIPYLREQGHGVVVNVASVAGKFGWAHVAAYSASKHGVVGLSETLRQELSDAPHVHVCTVLPAAIDTAIFQHAANYTGRQVTAAPPLSPVEDVAAAIVRCATHPRREVRVGLGATSMVLAYRVVPRLFSWASTRITERLFIRPGPAATSDGNLFAATAGGSELRGGWLSARQAWLQHAAVVAGLAAAGAVAGAVVVSRLHGRRG